jgi:hypothetical protein
VGKEKTKQNGKFSVTGMPRQRQYENTYIFELEPESGTQDDREKRKPTQTIASVSWEVEKGILDEGYPDCLDGPRDDRVGDETENYDRDERPGKEGLHDPSVAGRVEDGGRDPPAEDEGGEGHEAHAANEVTARTAGECEPRGDIFVRANVGHFRLGITIGKTSLLLREGGYRVRGFLLGDIPHESPTGSRGHF